MPSSHQVDVNNVFSQSSLKDTIYMTAPEGVKVAPGRALQILQSLYGLMQSAREWHSCHGVTGNLPVSSLDQL